tara:strand:+ start:5992 stop:6621 length:630 start_codon:yes stop_codon:yes gene_type:complete
MAEVNEIFGKVTGEQSFFKPSAKKEFIPCAKGEYFGHIIEVESKMLDVQQGKYKARLYTFVVEASTENKDKEFQYENIKGDLEKTKGDAYIGRKFRGKLWRFLEPQDDDAFESNSSGNKAYLRFCQNIGVECPTEKRTIDGEDVDVQLLPNLTTDDMLGQAIIAFVDKGKPYTDKNGVEKQFFDCKFCKKWDDGKRKDISSGGKNEIPF